MAERVNPFQQLVQYAEAFRTNWQTGFNDAKTREMFDRDLFDLLLLAMKCQQELNRR